MAKRKMHMNKQQMEMSFDHSMKSLPHPRHSQRRLRAQWWFNQMRVVVDAALDWEPARPARPEQTYLTLARGR